MLRTLAKMFGGSRASATSNDWRKDSDLVGVRADGISVVPGADGSIEVSAASTSTSSDGSSSSPRSRTSDATERF